jgi:hypothetical protein
MIGGCAASCGKTSFTPYLETRRTRRGFFWIGFSNNVNLRATGVLKVMVFSLYALRKIRRIAL